MLISVGDRCTLQSLTRIENQLRTPKQCDRFATRLIGHDGIPDLGRESAVEARGDAGNPSLAGGAEKIGLELDRGEIIRSLGQAGKRTVAAARVGEGDDRSSVQIAVRGEQLRPDCQSAGQASRFEGQEFDPDHAGQVTLSAEVELVKGGHRVGV